MKPSSETMHLGSLYVCFYEACIQSWVGNLYIEGKVVIHDYDDNLENWHGSRILVGLIYFPHLTSMFYLVLM